MLQAIEGVDTWHFGLGDNPTMISRFWAESIKRHNVNGLFQMDLSHRHKREIRAKPEWRLNFVLICSTISTPHPVTPWLHPPTAHSSPCPGPLLSHSTDFHKAIGLHSTSLLLKSSPSCAAFKSVFTVANTTMHFEPIKKKKSIVRRTHTVVLSKKMFHCDLVECDRKVSLHRKRSDWFWFLIWCHHLKQSDEEVP